MKATVLVRPKEGILDPQGEAVQSPRASVVAAQSLGLDGGLAHAGCGSLASLR